MMKIPEILYKISKQLSSQDAKAIIVGGSVRDYFLHLVVKDYDIEVYGLESIDELEELLKSFGYVKLVGKSFGVLKFVFEKKEYDFSFPRHEKKNGVGHKGFDVVSDGFMEFKEAAKRRDFTINSMGYDIESGKFLDPYGGRLDIEKKVLRFVDAKTFVEDPLRVYRGVQFCARFDFQMEKETFKLCSFVVENGELEELAKERVFDEIKKLLLKSKKPSIGFELFRELGVLKYFPELEAIIGVEQEPKWHPEGDVWIHTMMCVDEMQGLLSADDEKNIMFMLAILCHDFGKPDTTKEIDGRIRALGHEASGIKPTESFLKRVTNETNLINSILPLVKYHLAPSQFFTQNSSDKAIRKLATKVNLEELELVARADFLGRTTKESLSRDYKAGEWFLKKASKLKVRKKPLEKLLLGRDLIDLGFSPSSEFSKILDDIYQMQLEGLVNDKNEALEIVKKRYKI